MFWKKCIKCGCRISNWNQTTFYNAVFIANNPVLCQDCWRDVNDKMKNLNEPSNIGKEIRQILEENKKFMEESFRALNYKREAVETYEKRIEELEKENQQLAKDYQDLARSYEDEIAELEAEYISLEEVTLDQIERRLELAEALRFYALPENWEADIGLICNVRGDEGRLARSVLGKEDE